MPSIDTFPYEAPAQDDLYHVFLMRFGTLERSAPDNFVHRDVHDGPMPLDYGLWIIRNAHRTVLLDTGYGPSAATARRRPMEFDPIEGLIRIGIHPDTIDDIVISHLHYDHAGNVDRFPNACFHVQDAEMAFATGRSMGERVLRQVFDVDDVVTLVRRTYAEQVRFHDGDDDLLPGLTLHAFPGHSAMVQGVRVNTPRGDVLLASDAVHYYANILLRNPFALTLDCARTLESYSRIWRVAGSIDRIIPGHDPKVRQLYPRYDVAGIELYALHEAPRTIELEELARTDNF